MSIIALTDILPGDIIKASVLIEGVLTERLGKVARISQYGLVTDEGGVLYDSGWFGKYTVDLIDRPKPPLPTATGAVIIAEVVEGMWNVGPMFLRPDCRWEFIGTGMTVSPLSIKEWTPAKVVEA